MTVLSVPDFSELAVKTLQYGFLASKSEMIRAGVAKNMFSKFVDLSDMFLQVRVRLVHLTLYYLITNNVLKLDPWWLDSRKAFQFKNTSSHADDQWSKSQRTKEAST